MREALFFEEVAGDKKIVECVLCPHRCRIAVGSVGLCKTRVNIDGLLYSKTYGEICSLGVDPIEKKPLYHFYPASKILSLGSYGCNFSCSFCQNWQISQQEVVTERYQPQAIIDLAIANNSVGIAYTYNEPLINYEFLLETAKLARDAELRNVVVTNGYINCEPLLELLPYIDAVNLDIKAGSEKFYREVCGGSLREVLASAELFAESVHLEVTTLLIPTYNDDAGELRWLSSWIAEHCGADTPAHISAYFPRYQLQAPATGRDDIMQAVAIFKEALSYVYAGNIELGVAGSSTYCAGCGAELIRRSGYLTDLVHLDSGGNCSECGAGNNIKVG